MKRKIEGITAVAIPVDTKALVELESVDAQEATAAKPSDAKDSAVLLNWLTEQAKTHGSCFLLAHLDDGVVWGEMFGDRLVLASEVLREMEPQNNPEVKAAYDFTPPLRLETLQQARLFGENAELLLWRDGDNKLSARLIKDTNDPTSADWLEYFDEPQLLWGTHGIPAKIESDHELNEKFTLIWEGSQGMHQIIPIKLEVDDNSKIVKNKAPKLRVRHYLNKEGEARIMASRLVGVDNNSNDEEVNHG